MDEEDGSSSGMLCIIRRRLFTIYTRTKRVDNRTGFVLVWYAPCFSFVRSECMRSIVS